MKLRDIYCDYSLRLIVCFSFIFVLSACGGEVKVDESESITITLTDTGTAATLTWTTPTKMDGTPLPEQTYYMIYYGTSSGYYNYTGAVDVGSATTYTVNGLTSGIKYYFAVMAYNTSGAFALSNEESKDVP